MSEDQLTPSIIDFLRACQFEWPATQRRVSLTGDYTCPSCRLVWRSSCDWPLSASDCLECGQRTPTETLYVEMPSPTGQPSTFLIRKPVDFTSPVDTRTSSCEMTAKMMIDQLKRLSFTSDELLLDLIAFDDDEEEDAAKQEPRFQPEDWDDHLDNSVAYKMMLSMGWSPGKGLGVNLQGPTRPVEAVGNYRRRTLGYQEEQDAHYQFKPLDGIDFVSFVEDVNNNNSQHWLDPACDEVLTSDERCRLWVWDSMAWNSVGADSWADLGQSDGGNEVWSFKSC